MERDHRTLRRGDPYADMVGSNADMMGAWALAVAVVALLLLPWCA